MMSAAELDFTVPPSPAQMLAAVRNQLRQITNSNALLESYRRESLGRLSTTVQRSDSEAAAVDLAYAMRWLELAEDLAPARPRLELLNGMADE
jgi:hypothetical protein